MLRLFAFALLVCAICGGDDAPFLTTDDNGYVTVIQGFATQLQCVLNTCSDQVVWYKDDVLLFHGTQFQNTSGLSPDGYRLAHKIDIDKDKVCSGECSDSQRCAAGSHCVDNKCCPCAREDFTLVLKNLTFEDAGRYKCQIANQSELLEFQVEVLESGLKGGFHENISYDHSECCQKKGISPLCRAMCKPSEMAEHHFDPTSCKTDDYKNFLHCATDGGNRSHVHCCKTQLVPSFCYDFCSGDFQMLRRSHRLCLYYLPEIFECYNRAYLPYPDPPEDVTVNAIGTDQLSVCWKPPKVHDSNKEYPVVDYTVYYKQIPTFPFLDGALEGGIPLLTGDYTEIGDLSDDDYSDGEGHEAIAEGTDPLPGGRPSRRRRSVEEMADDEMKVFVAASRRHVSSSGLTVESSTRDKRQTWVFVTRDENGNTSSVREFNFQHVNTSNTCITLPDLRAATRYIIYATARNGYGVSVPSVRNIASTNVHSVASNDSLPDSNQCCVSRNVSSFCASRMCDTSSDPSNLALISISTSCRNEWPKVAPCIADGRNHTDCCLRKKVHKDCLGICAGSTSPLSSHAVLCLTLDLAAIYQCIREGYETHPSSPINVTVHGVTSSSASIEWAEPATNPHLVDTYTLYIRKNEHAAPVRQVHNAMSPHIEYALEPDSEYTVSVQSHSSNGTSLPSTTVLFQTLPARERVCPVGEPLFHTGGRPFLCRESVSPCPQGYMCTDVDDESYCCPREAMRSSDTFSLCCMETGVKKECQQYCAYNSTLSEECKDDLEAWSRCASDGMDHSRCCEQEGVPKECMDACRHPFKVASTCHVHSSQYLRCFSQRHSMLPSAVKNIEVSAFDAHSATLEWMDAEEVDVFEVQLFKNGKVVSRTNVTVDVLEMKDLEAATEYQARVIAFNAVGSSPPSWNVTFSTWPENDEMADRPRAPLGVRIVWNYGTRVNITWNPVTSRRNGDNVTAPIEYTLYSVDQETEGQWSTTKSNTTWAVLPSLHTDHLYSVYVTASEGEKTSRSSSIITLLAQPDSYGLPEPSISLMPDRSEFNEGDKIAANCSLASREKTLNIDITWGDNTVNNEPGVHWVSTEIVASASLDTITCAVSDTDGRQNVAMKSVVVKFGPSAHMRRDEVRAFDDLWADIKCDVKGHPPPTVRFEKNGKKANGEVRQKNIALNTFEYTLTIRNVTGNEGAYVCVAERDGKKAESSATLSITRARLPSDPRSILSCCEKESVDVDCLDVCAIGKLPSPSTNCSEHSAAFLKCADDEKDHSECCARRGVSRKCLPLCSGDAGVEGCERFAQDILSCSVRSHESAPLQLEKLDYEVVNDDVIKIKWSDPNAAKENFVYYAVYYKEADSDDEYKVVKSMKPSADIPVSPGRAYDVAVLAANAFGTSPLAFLDVPDTHQADAKSKSPSSSSTSSSSSWWPSLLVLFLLLSVAVVGLVVLTRRGDITNPLQRFMGARHTNLSANPSVAFENPGFNSEVEIRGLGGSSSEWQTPSLEVAGAADTTANRYAKLDT